MEYRTLSERVESMRSGEIPLPSLTPEPNTKGNGPTLHKIITAFRRVPGRNWAWVHFYFAFAAWSVILGHNPPAAVYQIQRHPAIDLWTMGTIAGCVIAAIGLIIESQSSKWVGFGAAVELIGHVGMTLAPVIYGLTQVALVIAAAQHPEALPPGTGPFDRLHLPFMSYALLSAVAVRAVVVIPRFRREANDPRKDVR